MPRRLKECDGTAADYWRHYRRGEEACDASKKAAAAAKRRWRKTGLWHARLPYTPLDDELIYPVTEKGVAQTQKFRDTVAENVKRRKEAKHGDPAE